ncbi:MAG: hypothetical protein PUF89_00820 [Lactobacillus porci]|nr:hypothetical protein [Lactobacillus porci]
MFNGISANNGAGEAVLGNDWQVEAAGGAAIAQLVVLLLTISK